MRSVITVAAGLVATTSAAGLRSKTTADTSLIAVQALAEKYDCAVGGKSLESVLDEIGTKNAQTQADLEESCYGSFNKYNDVLQKAEDKVHTMRVKATPNANQNMQNKIEKAKTAYDSLNAQHAKTVSDASDHSDAMQTKFDAETKSFASSKSTYETEVDLLVTDRATAAANYAAAIAKGIADLAAGKLEEDTLRNDKITEAGNVKTADNAACKGTYKARQDIVADDQDIVDALAGLVNELNELDSRAAPRSLLEIRERVHANYDDLLTKKSAAIDEWAGQCKTNLATIQGELDSANGVAKGILDGTEKIHGDVYTGTMNAANTVLDTLTDRHSGIVAGKQSTDDAAQADYKTKHATWVAADENHSQVQQVVSEERADAKTTQTEENNSTEDNRVAEQKGYLAFETTTVNKAESDKQSALGECKASFKARSELIAGDQKLLNEIAPLLAKLKACKGSTSLLEIELAKASSLDSMSCAAAAERYQEITTQTSLLETTEAAPTDGNLASFSARVGEENIEATRVRDECNKAANDSFASKKAAAATLKTDRNTKSDGDAKDATDQTNLQFETTSTALDARYKAAKDPWVIATGLDLLAQTASEKSAAELAAALAAQKKEVTAGTALHLQIKTEATALRKNNIAADRTAAKKIQDDAAADHLAKTTKETNLCDHESAQLASEQKKLASVVGRMKELQKAHKGLSGTDQTSMSEDVANMNKALNNERASAEEQKTSCLGAAAELHTTTVNAANDYYDEREGEYELAKTNADAAAETTKTNEFDAHATREGTNENMWSKANADRDLADSNNVAAKAAHVTAKEIQSTEMDRSYAHMAEVNQRAPKERQAEIDHEYSEAVLHEKMHVDTHARASKNMKDECNDERKMLKDERDTLKVTRSTINKLTAVRTDGGMGAANDYTATTTQAPTWERL